MQNIRILHNPRCSKSRAGLELLSGKTPEVEVVRYLDTPLSRSDLEFVVNNLDVDCSELVRKDAYFKELGLNANDFVTPDAVVDLLVEHPRLMERPVLVLADKAILGRPPTKFEEYLQ